MTFYNLEAAEPSPCATKTLNILSAALSGKIVPSLKRVIATADSRCPDEGLALLKAYVAIEDRRLRQAILDAVLAISQDDTGR